MSAAGTDNRPAGIAAGERFRSWAEIAARHGVSVSEDEVVAILATLEQEVAT